MQFNFLICSERSGSNLISKIIDAHPDVCAPFPSHMINFISSNLYRYGDLSTDENWGILLEDTAFYLQNKFSEWQSEVTAEMLKDNVEERNLGAIVRYVYETEAKVHGKTSVFIKENHTYRWASFILSHFPDAKFIWLARDPRDMALTWKELASNGGAVTGARVWKEDQHETMKLYACLKPLGKILSLKFEDLLTDTEDTVQKVCDFLQIPYSGEMLEFHKKTLTSQNSNKMVSWRDLQEPVKKDNFNLYKDKLSESEIRYIEALCKEEMIFLGYSRDFEENASLEVLEKKALSISYEERVRTDIENEAYEKFWKGIERIKSRHLYDGEAVK